MGDHQVTMGVKSLSHGTPRHWQPGQGENESQTPRILRIAYGKWNGLKSR